MKLALATLIVFSVIALSAFVTVSSESARERRIDLLEARVNCDESQVQSIVDDAVHPNASPHSPPATYCPYLAEVQPDLLLKDYGKNALN